MATLLVYLLLVASIVYFISSRRNSGRGSLLGLSENKESRHTFLPGDVWKQVYETASMEEAIQIRTRLTQERIECVLYEQGKKDIHGNPLLGVGVAVRAASADRAQSVISKMPV